MHIECKGGGGFVQDGRIITWGSAAAGGDCKEADRTRVSRARVDDLINALSSNDSPFLGTLNHKPRSS